MKKIITSIFAFMLVSGLTAGVAFASGQFNQLPTCAAGQQTNCDLPTVMVTNTQCSAGPGSGCYSTSINAQPGDYIWVHVYYHNTSGGNVSNVALHLNNLQNSGSRTSFTASGGIVSDAQGSATVSLPSAQTMTFVAAQLNGQYVANANDLFTGSGLAIGSVGANQQGNLVAKFQVSNTVVNTDNCTINSFTANGSSYTTINQGSSASLVWSTTGCTSANISNVGVVTPNNSVLVLPSSTTTYVLSAYGSSGVAHTAQVTVNVNTIVNNYCDITFTADQYSINQGSSTYLRWTSSGSITSVQIYPTVGSQGSSGSASVSPTNSTQYTLTAYGCSTSYTRTLTINVNGVINPPPLGVAPQAITTVATVLSSTQARINGISIPNTTTSTTNAWFEWGSSYSLGSSTAPQGIPTNSTSNYYNYVLSGLVPGRAYYYRAVTQNQNGTAYGDIVRFVTQSNLPPIVITPPPQVIIRPVTTTNVVTAQSAPSLLELRVESNYNTMCVGGTIDYTVTYHNISNQVLQKTVLRFTHPKEVTFISASRGDYEVVERTLTIDLGNVNPGEQGIITVHAAINDSAVRGNLTVTTATVVYTNTVTRGQEDAIAYSLITVSDTCPNVLGASVLGFGSFLPHTLLEWLLLILVIFALVVLGRHYYRKNEQSKVE